MTNNAWLNVIQPLQKNEPVLFAILSNLDNVKFFPNNLFAIELDNAFEYQILLKNKDKLPPNLDLILKQKNISNSIIIKKLQEFFAPYLEIDNKN
ncbi:MAG: hypothetical protein LBH47_00200 [Christensenellaceae bacterium]|jgi:hypothetical protein|nr:hypothetical protein [Christensenellaceae bacterium]